MTTALADRPRVEAYLNARTIRGDDPDDCWLWQNKPDKDGYGLAYYAGKQWRAHRLSYTFRVGPIPDGHDLDHTCEVRLCVRPSHLEPVTNFENFVRKYLRQGRTLEDAEKLATFDLEAIRRTHEQKVAQREQATRDAAAAAASGFEVGDLARRGAGKTAALWTVIGVFAGERHTLVEIESTVSGHSMLVDSMTLTRAGA